MKSKNKEISAKSKILDFSHSYIERLKSILNTFDHQAVAAFIQVLETARNNDNTIYFIGNGGSAATASHFSNDISYGTRNWSKPFKSISLTDNVAVLTAVANDYSFEEIFVKQLQVNLNPKDVVVAISASGNSPNIVKAIEYANSVGAVTVGICGFTGGKLKEISQYPIHVTSEKGEYGPVEDVHMIIDHLVGNYLLREYRE